MKNFILIVLLFSFYKMNGKLIKVNAQLGPSILNDYNKNILIGSNSINLINNNKFKFGFNSNFEFILIDKYTLTLSLLNSNQKVTLKQIDFNNLLPLGNTMEYSLSNGIKNLTLNFGFPLIIKPNYTLKLNLGGGVCFSNFNTINTKRSIFYNGDTTYKGLFYDTYIMPNANSFSYEKYKFGLLEFGIKYQKNISKKSSIIFYLSEYIPFSNNFQDVLYRSVVTLKDGTYSNFQAYLNSKIYSRNFSVIYSYKLK